MLELRDGSRLVGVPLVDALMVQTAYKKIELPLKRIDTVEFTADRRTARINLRNRDHLEGALDVQAIKMKLTYGTFSISLADVNRLSTRTGGGVTMGEGLILHYSFNRDEGDQVADQSGRGNDGRVRGANYTPHGKPGGAMEFDGTGSEIVVANNPTLNPTKEITVAAWVKIAGIGTNNGIILCKGTPPRGGTAQYALAYFTDSGNRGKVSFSIRTKGTPVWNDYISDQPVKQDVWLHLVGTYKSGEHNLYVNGQRARPTETKVKGEIAVEAGDLFIGSEHSFPSDEYFKGVMDEVQIYNRALTPEEVQRLHDAQP